MESRWVDTLKWRTWCGVVEVRSIATKARPLNYLFPLAQNRSALPLWATRGKAGGGGSNLIFITIM